MSSAVSNQPSLNSAFSFVGKSVKENPELAVTLVFAGAGYLVSLYACKKLEQLFKNPTSGADFSLAVPWNSIIKEADGVNTKKDLFVKSDGNDIEQIRRFIGIEEEQVKGGVVFKKVSDKKIFLQPNRICKNSGEFDQLYVNTGFMNYDYSVDTDILDKNSKELLSEYSYLPKNSNDGDRVELCLNRGTLKENKKILTERWILVGAATGLLLSTIVSFAAKAFSFFGRKQ